MQLMLMRIGFSALWALAALYLGSKALLALRLKRDWHKRGIVTDGVIVDFKAELPTGDMDNTRGKFYAPIVEYPAGPGTTARITSRSSNRPNPYTVGQRVAIRYLPEDPLNGELDTVSVSWFFFGALVIGTVVTLAVASLPWLLGPPTPR